MARLPTFTVVQSDGFRWSPARYRVLAAALATVDEMPGKRYTTAAACATVAGCSVAAARSVLDHLALLDVLQRQAGQGSWPAMYGLKCRTRALPRPHRRR